MRSFILIALFALSTIAHAKDTYVHGYSRNNGTYVQPHYRTAPDSNPYNNYSTKGNINPYTGQAGTKNPYGSNQNSNYGNQNSYNDSTNSDN
jgi:hypothetical protein